MAIFRNIQISFWTDAKIVDDFTPEDKYFYLYLFTNPHTNLCGCYEVSKTQMSVELGYSNETIDRLLVRFETLHNVIRYNTDSKEILLLNWHKYNWTKSSSFRSALLKEIKSVKCNGFREYLESIEHGIDTVSTPSPHGGGTTVTVTVTDTVTDTVTENRKRGMGKREETAQRIIDNYHLQCPSLPKVIKLTDKRIKAVNARLKEYTEEDLEKAFIKAELSDFLSGRKTDWNCDFDWLMNPNNIVKVLEGNYDNKNETKKLDDYLEKWAKGEDNGKSGVFSFG